jgi:hypothetical protein
MWAILSQRNVKSHVEIHANDQYCKCCFEICLIVYIVLEGINKKLILIVPKPLLGYNCMLFPFSKFDHLFSPRLNSQGTNIHTFLLYAWISKHFYLQKENYDQLWCLTKIIPASLCCRDRKSHTRLLI